MPAQTKTTTTDARVDAQLINKAVGALLKHHTAHYAAQNDTLLGNDSIISVHIGLEKVPTHPSPKPKRITIPHSIYKTGNDDDSDLEEPSVCLIVKEDSKEWIQELIAQFPNEMGLVKKVMGIDSLRQKHAKFEQQRALLARFDVFMADDRILPMLAKACGKHFFNAKKQPLPICVTRKTSLPSVILQSLRSTYWYLSQGTCLAIKVGTTAMPAKHVMQNIAAVCAIVPTKIPRQWANVRSIAIKTTHSTSLPIYNKTPSELMDIATMAGLDVVNGGVSTKKQKKTDAVAATPTKQQVKEELAAKKKRKAKSPLIKALKKQQDEDGEKTPESKLKKQKTTESSTKKKPKVAVEKSPEKKRKMSMDKSDTPKSTKKPSSAKKAKVETPKASSAKKAKVETPKASSAKKAKVETPKASSAKKTKAETPKSSSKKAVKAETPKSASKKDATYMASKKFNGSKKGYAYKLGTKGLGYYVDVKPKVDPKAVEAFRRMKSQGVGGGSNSGKKPKRRSNRR